MVSFLCCLANLKTFKVFFFFFFTLLADTLQTIFYFCLICNSFWTNHEQMVTSCQEVPKTRHRYSFARMSLHLFPRYDKGLLLSLTIQRAVTVKTEHHKLGWHFLQEFTVEKCTENYLPKNNKVP